MSFGLLVKVKIVYKVYSKRVAGSYKELSEYFYVFILWQ